MRYSRIPTRDFSADASGEILPLGSIKLQSVVTVPKNVSLVVADSRITSNAIGWLACHSVRSHGTFHFDRIDSSIRTTSQDKRTSNIMFSCYKKTGRLRLFLSFFPHDHQAQNCKSTAKLSSEPQNLISQENLISHKQTTPKEPGVTILVSQPKSQRQTAQKHLTLQSRSKSKGFLCE